MESSVVMRGDLRSWLGAFCDGRGVGQPIGSPLYSLKVSDIEFASLSDELKHHSKESCQPSESAAYAACWLLAALCRRMVEAVL